MASPTESTSTFILLIVIDVVIVGFGSFLRAFDMTSWASIAMRCDAMRCDALQLWLWREVGQVQILCWYFLINLISIDDGAKSSAYITWKLHYTFPHQVALSLLSSVPPPFAFFIPCEKAQPKSLRMQSASGQRRTVWGKGGAGLLIFIYVVVGERLAGYLSFTYDKHSVVYCEKDSLAWAHNVLKDIRSDCSFECRHTFTSCRVKNNPQLT